MVQWLIHAPLLPCPALSPPPPPTTTHTSPPPPQIRAIRKKMVDIMSREASSCDLKDLVAKFIPEAIGKDIEKACQGGWRWVCGCGGNTGGGQDRGGAGGGCSWHRHRPA